MKPSLILASLFLLLAIACTKKNNTNITPINSSLQSCFNFKQGSYWIYRDSLTGLMDSAYVAGYTTYASQLSCVLRANLPYFQVTLISIKVNDGNPSDSEVWNLTLIDTTFTLSLVKWKNQVETELQLQPFTYPFKTGNSTNIIDGCLLYADSGYVPNISTMNLNNQDFANTAQFNHQGRSNTGYVYDDCFYLCPGTGFIKVAFNQPIDSDYRVLELQRYKIVK